MGCNVCDASILIAHSSPQKRVQLEQYFVLFHKLLLILIGDYGLRIHRLGVPHVGHLGDGIGLLGRCGDSGSALRIGNHMLGQGFILVPRHVFQSEDIIGVVVHP